MLSRSDSEIAEGQIAGTVDRTASGETTSNPLLGSDDFEVTLDTACFFRLWTLQFTPHLFYLTYAMRVALSNKRQIS